MTILSITTEFAGEVGVAPRLVRIVCNDPSSVYMSLGYLNNASQNGYKFFNSDFVNLYSTSDGYANIYKILKSSGNISLVPINAQNSSPSAPVVVGTLPAFINIDGVLGATSITSSSIVTYSGSTVSGNVPVFNNTTGRINDSGTALSALQLKSNIYCNTSNYAGGSANFNLTLTNLSSSSIAFAQYRTQTNASEILTVTTSANTISITSTADPGASTLNILAFFASQ